MLRDASAMIAEREAPRKGIENSGRTVQYKLNAQSLRLFGLHSDVNDAHRAGANRLQNKQQTDKLHCTINDTSGHGDRIRNTSAGALWAGTAHTSVPDDGKFLSEQMTPMDTTGDNGCRPFHARDRDSLIVDQLDKVMSEIHVRGFNRMRQDEELFTYEAYRIRYISDLSYADGELATEQNFVAENDAAIGLFFIFGPMLYKQSTHTKTEFCVQQKVAKAIRQNLGTSASEMSNGVVLTLSLVCGIATDVAASPECPDSEFCF